MRIPVAEAGGKLEELLDRAVGGEEIVLTKDDGISVQLQPIRTRVPTPEEKEAIMREIMESGRHNAGPGPSAARSQDFLYDEDGLPT